MPPHRILLVNHVSRIGGAERSLLDLVRHLDRTRFEPQVALPADGELPAKLKELGITCHFLPLRRLHRTYNPFALAGAAISVSAVAGQLARLIRREQIALVHANSTTAQLYAGSAARQSGVPCLWHVRDLALPGLLGRWLAARASAIVAISDCVRRQVAPYARDPTCVATIRHGIDLQPCRRHPSPLSSPPRGEAEKGEPDTASPGVGPWEVTLSNKTPSPSRGEGRGEGTCSRFIPNGGDGRAPLFLMVAQLVPWKNHLAFIEAAARLAASLPTARFVIAGDDLFGEHPAYRTALERRAEQLGLKDRLVFAGYRLDIGALLNTCDVLIHPATREPLGRVILEAMAAGKPVVAVNAGGPAEIVRHERDGLLTATAAPDELAAAALRLIQDPALAERLGATARQRVGDGFDIRRTVREIEALYAKLLCPRGTPCA
jgi:glycosyltransferase involved in cell wall biosynthesis